MSSVQLSWSAVSPPGSTYTVLRNGAVLVAGIAATSYLDATVADNTAYTYAVAAVNGNGTGLPSVPAAATTPPAQVTGLTATPLSSSSIGTAWTATPGASTYTVDRGGTPVGTPATNAFTDTGLAASTNYTYTVAANGAGGQGAFSAPASATTQAGSQTIVFNAGARGVIGSIGGYGGTGSSAVTAAVNALKAEALIVDGFNASGLIKGMEICLNVPLLFPVNQGDWANSQAIPILTQVWQYMQTLPNVPAGGYDISLQVNMVGNTHGNQLITQSIATGFCPTWWYDNAAFGPTGGNPTTGGQHGGIYWDQSANGQITLRFWNAACLADMTSALTATYRALKTAGIHLYRVDSFMEITRSPQMVNGGYSTSTFISVIGGSSGYAANLRAGLPDSILMARPTYAGASITDNMPQIIQAFVASKWTMSDYDTCNEVIPPDLASGTSRNRSSYLSLAFRGQQSVGGPVVTTNFKALGHDYHCNIGQDEQGNSGTSNTAPCPPADIGCGRFEDYLIQFRNLGASHLYFQSERFKGPRCNILGTFTNQPANYHYPTSGAQVTSTNAIDHWNAINVMGSLDLTYPGAW